MEFGEQSGEFDGPEAEVGDGAPDGSGCAGAEVIEDGCHETEILLVGLGGGQELLGNFGDEVEGAGRMEVARQAELRMHELAGIDVHQFAIFALKIRHPDMRKPLQTGTKTAFRPPRATGYASQLSGIAGQKTDDQVSFLEWPGLQDEGFAHASGH